MKFRSAAIYPLIFCATLVTMEMVARAIDWTPVMRPAEQGDSLGLRRYYHAFDGVGDLVGNQDGHWIIWFHRPYHVVTNSVGLRNVEEPRSDAFRILALGDSQTFGPYVTNEDTWPARVEANLRRRSLNVQVFNAGIAGYSIGDELALFREKILSFRPNLVLLGVFENDVTDLRKERGGLVQRPSSSMTGQLLNFVKPLVRDFALYALAERLSLSLDLKHAGVDPRGADVGRQMSARAEDDLPSLEARYSELFQAFVKEAEAANIPIAVLFLPAAEAAAGRATSRVEGLVRSLSQTARLPYLDLTSAFAGDSDAEERFFLLNRSPNGFEGNGHFSREGYRTIGEAVSRFLVDARLVGSP